MSLFELSSRWIRLGLVLAIGVSQAKASWSQDAAVEGMPGLDRSQLVAWCIVPFDAQRRGPRERAAMLKRLGIHRLAYDYRAEHIGTFAEEIEALQAAQIELTAWWFPQQMNAEARMILDLIQKHAIHPQLWVMGGGGPEDSSLAARERHLQAEVERIQAIASAAAEVGCQVGLYNHGGWFGDPRNQLEIIRRLPNRNVGIVYNLHHAHDQLDQFPQHLKEIAPHLMCLNLNGMRRGADREGKKIMPLGAGELDLAILQAISDSGYRGPLGILNHTELDAELRLRDNLAGWNWLVEGIAGRPLPPPEFVTWPGPAEQTDSFLELADNERQWIQELLSEVRTHGNAERGLTVFASLQTSCFSCHRMGEQGAAIGPDLTGIAARRPAEELVAALFWPNRSVADQYRATILLQDDGTTWRGFCLAEDDETVTIRDPSSGRETRLAKSSIEERRLGESLMPNELMAALSRQQQIDLIRLLLEVGVDARLEMSLVNSVLAHAVARQPESFSWIRDPLEPERWPSWQAHVNRDRLYDFYTKQAEYFRVRPHGPLLAAAPELDSDKYGHWGNQDEQTWRGNEWNDTELGSLHCGVFLGDGLRVTRGICVRIGDDLSHAVCFNPDNLQYELVWKGFLRFSDIRHGFMDGIHQSGETVERPRFELPPGEITYQGFYRYGPRVIFAYRIGEVDYLDSPWFENGRFVRQVGPRAEHPLAAWTNGGPSQWPQQMETRVRLGNDSPYAIDTIELPLNNPWKAHLYGGDHAFFADGSALYATMPGDVWWVSHFAGPAESQPAERNPSDWPGQATWRRFAAGLHQPLGMWIDKEGIFVMCRDQLLRLHDLNADGEADFYECFSRQHQTSPAAHDYICGLQRDRDGNFYTASGNQGLVRISADGREARSLARGFRNPDGLGLYPDGVVTVPCSEGDWTPASMVCAIRVDEGLSRSPDDPLYFGHGGPRNGLPPELPMLYLPRNVDNSCGGQVFVESDRFGPLQNQLLHFSYGMGSHFLVLRDQVDGQFQAAAVPLVGEFLSGSHRGKFSPRDGQLYVSGMGGWGNYSPDWGCFQRVRYTEEPVQLPIGYRVHENGIALTFSQPLSAPQALNPRQHFAQVWNYRYSGAYGSPEYVPGHQGMIGHEVWQIAAVHRLDEGRTLFLEIPELQPVNQLHLRLNVDPQRGQDVFCTIHRLGPPRTDLPGYRPLVKQVARHPIEFDLALVNRRRPNPWREPVADSRALRIEAGINLSFHVRELRARAGERLALEFQNPDVVPHNWVLAQPGSLDRVGIASNKLIADPDAYLNHYVPDSADVLCFTDIVEPGQATVIYFQAPEQPGRYPFLCTFPGHWMVMNGELIVE